MNQFGCTYIFHNFLPSEHNLFSVSLSSSHGDPAGSWVRLPHTSHGLGWDGMGMGMGMWEQGVPCSGTAGTHQGGEGSPQPLLSPHCTHLREAGSSAESPAVPPYPGGCAGGKVGQPVGQSICPSSATSPELLQGHNNAQKWFYFLILLEQPKQQ